MPAGVARRILPGLEWLFRHHSSLPDPDSADRGIEFLIARMGVRDRSNRIRVPSEALGEEEVLRRSVDARDRGVTEGVEVVDRLEARLTLPVGEDRLDTAEREATGLARLEEWRSLRHRVAAHAL